MKDALIGAAAAMSAVAALLAAFYSEDPAERKRKVADKGVSPEEGLRPAKGRGKWYAFGLVVVPALAAVGLNIATILRPPSSGMHALEKDTLLSAAAAMSASAALLAAFYGGNSAKRQREVAKKGVSPAEALRRATGRGRWYAFGLAMVPALAAVGLDIAAIVVPRLT